MAFQRDACRAETIQLISSASDAELDYDDPERLLPAWATWRTPRQLAQHIADTETRHYVASLGVSPPPRDLDLVTDWLVPPSTSGPRCRRCRPLLLSRRAARSGPHSNRWAGSQRRPRCECSRAAWRSGSDGSTSLERSWRRPPSTATRGHRTSAPRPGTLPTKVLRRLAWHERGEFVLRQLLAQAQAGHSGSRDLHHGPRIRDRTYDLEH